MIVSTFCRFSTGTSALTESASSKKFTDWIPAGVTISRVPSSVIPTIAIFTPLKWCDLVRREDRLAGRLVGDVRRQEIELGTGEAVAVLTAVDRMAAAVLHPQELVDALVELVVADAVVVETHQVEGLDRRLVVEERGDERRRADQVARGDEQRVRVRRLELADVRRQILDATGEVAGRCEAGRPCQRADPAARARRRLEVAVEVVQSQDLDLGGLGLLRLARRRSAGSERGRDDRKRERHEDQQWFLHRLPLG